MWDNKVLAAIDEVLTILKNNGVEISKEIRSECIAVSKKEIDVDGFLDRIRKEFDERDKNIL